ncbi:hypothetical protein [Microcystis sp. M42BS1]|uniref:hypothetical protein n=1 Tax=Microcystis sp. M42BS1 TaxID=2771192 RepID=UPI00258287F5|nr:hypothetical protein [Microcystis sp. M42BS1]MCA2570658.1 hypothetical protein [Microcystis sp. M42BS1]
MFVKTVKKTDDGYTVVTVHLTEDQTQMILQTGLQFLMARGALTLTSIDEEFEGVEIDSSKMN